ncbi:MAG: aconitate hydratase AcnA [Desulfobacterales bacterium]|jgi:aconitate hydratase
MEKQDYIRQLKIGDQEYTIADINLLEEKGIADVTRLPFSIRILVENLLRKLDGRVVREQDLLNIAGWAKHYDEPVEIPYHPARVLMQDFTGVPAVVDLAAMRDAIKELGGDPMKINPLVPVDLIVDHSIQVDYFGTRDALIRNVAKEYERNGERYALLKWAQKSFDNFRVVPPNSGICHQVNLEYLGRVVMTEEIDGRIVAYPDTLVGTDSHTTMIDAIGVMGWGVGGIEAEAVMLGQPYYMSIPQVIGVKMVGELMPGITATDLVLVVTELLRRHNVVEKFVEFFGPGMKRLTIPDRATISNMTPEYGATLGFFPVDEKTIKYLKLTNREDHAKTVEHYTKEQGLFYTGGDDPEYTEVLEIDLGTIEPSVAGPARPQDRIAVKGLKKHFAGILGCDYDRDADIAHVSKFHDESGSQTVRPQACRPVRAGMYDVNLYGKETKICDGCVVIAAITSCTNTSNPSVLLGAGLLAKNAVQKGLKVPDYVKTSLAPGSKVVIRYLGDAGLMPYLEAVGFHLAAFGCTTCIGNSGPLHPEIEKVISKNDLTVAAVLSGNRNFEARIHQSVKANFLASPMLVVAFALAGRVDVDFSLEPVGLDPNGEPVYLKDIWPSDEDIEKLIHHHVKREFFEFEYSRIFDGDEFWQNLKVAESTTFKWDKTSTYIKKPPYFENFDLHPAKPSEVAGARALLILGDSVTTDHISPAGAIPAEYPAGEYLIAENVEPNNFNSYGSRRGNHEVMMRGTFGNIRIKNKLVSPKEGSYTVKLPGNEETFVYDAAMDYMASATPLIVLAGGEYGTGSSRDWAAKGTALLGVKAVIAESFERIHRSNLVGMGVLPLVFTDGQTMDSLGLDGTETFRIDGVEEMKPRKVIPVKAIKRDGREIVFEVVVRLDTDVEVGYFENGGILPFVLRQILAQK